MDGCYRPEPFPRDRHRVEYLFALYEQLTAQLVAAAQPARKGRRVQTAYSRAPTFPANGTLLLKDAALERRQPLCFIALLRLPTAPACAAAFQGFAPPPVSMSAVECWVFRSRALYDRFRAALAVWGPDSSGKSSGRGILVGLPASQSSKISLAQPFPWCFITIQSEVLDHAKASAQRQASRRRGSDVFVMGRDVGPRGFARPSSSPARRCAEFRPYLLSHSNSAPLVAVRLCSRYRAAAARGFLRPGHLWRSSVPSLLRLPADPQPRSPCRLVLLLRGIPALCSTRGTRVLP